MQRPKYSGTRERCIRDAEKKLRQKVSRFQKLLSDRFINYFVDNLNVENGKITVDATNFAQVAKVDRIFDDWKDSRQAPILKHVINGLTELHGDNEKYFKSAVSKTIDSASKKAFNVLMGRIGWNANKERLIEGGFLHSIVDSDDPLTMLKAEALRAIVSGSSLADFKNNIEILARGRGTTPGVLERHYGQHVFDVFQQYDREVGRILAEKLGLKYAIYQGGLIKTSRPFCIHRNDKVFTIDEISLFGTPKDKYPGYTNKATGDFQGKPAVYSPFLDLGGYQCRHQLDWISNELGEVLRAQQDAEGEQAPNEFGNIQMTVEEFENGIVNLKNEKGGLYNRDGILQDVTGGTVNQISLDHLIGTDTFNHTFTHNHPSWILDPTEDGNSFSIPDVITSINMGLREIRAVTGGAVYRMIFDDEFEIGRKLEKGKVSKLQLQSIQATIVKIHRSIKEVMLKRIENDEITGEQANYLHWHLVWAKFVEGTKGIRYAKEKR